MTNTSKFDTFRIQIFKKEITKVIHQSSSTHRHSKLAETFHNYTDMKICKPNIN